MKLALRHLVLTSLLGLSTLCASAADVLISAAQLLDVRTGKMLSQPRVLVRDGRVIAVKSGKEAMVVDAAARKIDLPGMTLLPGLISGELRVTEAAKMVARADA